MGHQEWHETLIGVMLLLLGGAVLPLVIVLFSRTAQTSAQSLFYCTHSGLYPLALALVLRAEAAPVAID